MDTSEQQLTRTASTILVNQVISFFYSFSYYCHTHSVWEQQPPPPDGILQKDVCCIASFMSLENMHEPSNIFTVLLVNK